MTSSRNPEASSESAIENALRLYNSGDAAGARDIFRALAGTSAVTAEVLVGLGMSTLSCNDLVEAETCLRRATELNDRHDVAYRCLALLLIRKNDLAEAEKAATTSVQLAPGNAQNVFTLGIIKALRGDSDEAARCYQSALTLNPLYPEALLNCGGLALEQRDFRSAITSLVTAVTTKPDFVQAYWKLFEAIRDTGSRDEARALLSYLSALAPESREIKAALASFIDTTKDFTHPQQTSLDDNSTSPAQGDDTSLLAQINRYVPLPLVIDSAEEMYELRNALMEHFEYISSLPGEIEEPFTAIQISPDFLSSLPLRDRLVRAKVASLLSLKAPSLCFIAQHIAAWQEHSPLKTDVLPIPSEVLGERDLVNKAPHLLQRKIRLGICSTDLAQCTVGALFADLLACLPRNLFEISLFHSTPPTEPVNEQLSTRADSTYQLLNDVNGAAWQLSKAQLDVLVYTDLEASRLTYLLAFARLAPIQCVMWGLTETTGIPTIDYFLAPDALVGGRAQSQFSEHLVTFRHLAASCQMTHRSRKPSREDFNLPTQGTMFICPEYAQGIHPGMDYLIQRILQGDRNSFIVFPESADTTPTEHVLDRLRASMPDCMEQVFVSQVSSKQGLCNLIEISDIVLDALHCCNPLAIIQALHSGKPVVTLPGKALRSRTAGLCYRTAGYHETIARTREHYIQIALLLARDSGWRERVSEKSRFVYQALQEPINDASSELARFFLLALNKISTIETSQD